MSHTSEARAQAVLEAKGIVRSRDLERAGVSTTQIRRLMERGVIERVGRSGTSSASMWLWRRFARFATLTPRARS